ncbi:MAG: glycoside hydrolase family 13 protein, partial [Lachnospiraceae bacterium]|nr:glycoside hydrolase family 13 protein [Lachnospiraceae bacterium]
MLYTYHTKSLFQEKALFADETEYYREPAEPKPDEKVTFRFRTGVENAEQVILHIGNDEVVMEKRKQEGRFDYYEGTWKVGKDPVHYYFEIKKDGAACYYNKKGVIWEPEEFYHFRIAPGFATPAWAKGAVFYQIFVERFYNGDPSNDVLDNEYIYIEEGTKRVKDWEKYPAAMGVREFYGGDLKGVMDKLDYLSDLGVDVIYFNPLFVSPSNHKYDIQDYDYIDPHFGVILEDEGDLLELDQDTNDKASRYISRVTNKKNLEASNQLFVKLVEEAHKRGMKVILDGVFNHCGSFNKWLDREKIYEEQTGYEKGAYVDAASPYNSFFRFYDGDAWPYNSSYDGWWGHDTLPKLNYEDSPKLFEYIMDIARKWVAPPYNADGWRLDVAADLGRTAEYNHYFWREFRKTVKEANPEAIILAEHYGDPGDWLMGDQWDTVMNYDAFMEPITWFLTGMEKHSDEYRGELLGNSDAFFSAMSHHMSRFHRGSLDIAMNELSNHDHSRFLTRTN